MKDAYEEKESGIEVGVIFCDETQTISDQP